MATIFTHAIVAGSFQYFFKINSKRILFWSVVCSIAPDFDVITFALGIPYEHVMGHRGFTHSIVFSIIFACLVVLLSFGKEQRKMKLVLFCLFTLITISHGFLDAMTNGGYGIGFFIPFDNTRYFLPWTPIEVSPIGRNFLSNRGMITILSELKIVIMPIFVFIGMVFIYRKLTVKVDKEVKG